ncbi:hypothetical protein BASA83_013648 [Batrachochytrium salamandrivorans]|nr:hypothetical protein BASA83_013648 [Batrachochytrium salamandrivorans]
MDSKLAADLQIPLLELSTPIMLRLADGDSSSCLTHRTVPLQLHIGTHVETVTFYVTDLCHRVILGYSWLERHNPRINWASQMVEFDSPFCLENCRVVSSCIQADMYPFVKVSPFSDASIPPDILPNFSLLLPKDQNSILTHRPETYNSQINSLSCREDYKATSESFNFQQILTSTGS